MSVENSFIAFFHSSPPRREHRKRHPLRRMPIRNARLTMLTQIFWGVEVANRLVNLCIRSFTPEPKLKTLLPIVEFVITVLPPLNIEITPFLVNPGRHRDSRFSRQSIPRPEFIILGVFEPNLNNTRV